MSRKLACFGLGFALAELAAAYLPLLVSVLTAAVFVAALVLLREHRARPVLLGALTGFVYALVFFLAAVYPARQWEGVTVRCRAVIQTDCESSYRDEMLRGTLHIIEMDGKSADLYVSCTAFPGDKPGECFEAEFTFSGLEENAYRMTRQARGIYLQAEYIGGYRFLENSTALEFRLYQLRQMLSQQLRRWMPRTAGSLEAAMLLGDRSLLRESDENAFRTAGVSHLLAVSGLHISLLCGLVSFGRKRRFWRPAIAVRACAALFYMFLTGISVSVVRAGTVFLLALLGDFLLQPKDLLTSTGLAALLIGLQNAYAPCDLGFQLSFCAVLGVQIASALSQWEQKCTTWPEPVCRILDTLQCSAFAALATTPILIAHRMAVSGVSVLCNLLVVWMLQPALVAGLLVLLCTTAAFLEPVAHLLSILLSAWLNGMLAIIRWCAQLPYAQFSLPRRYTLFVFAVLGTLALLFWYAKKLRWYPIPAALCITAAIGMGVWMQRDIVTVALVGTAGNPCAVILQNGKAAVIFRGGSSNYHAVEEYLAEAGGPEWTTVVDLRNEPREMGFPAGTVYTVDRMDASDTVALSEGIVMELYHKGDGNLAVLDVEGYRIAFQSGSIRLAEPVLVNTFCAAGTLSEDIWADTILYTSKRPAWLEKIEEETLYYSSGTPEIIVRPGRSVSFEEVTRIAVQ